MGKKVRLWTADEDRLITNLYTSGTLLTDIVGLILKETGRVITPTGIAHRLKFLGVERPDIMRERIRLAKSRKAMEQRANETSRSMVEWGFIPGSRWPASVNFRTEGKS